MTTAEKYRQLERSPVINTARYIFNSIAKSSSITTIGDELEEIKTGKTPSKQEKRFYEDNYFNWFKPDEIGSNKYLYDASDKLSKYAIESNQVTIYEPDTVLINAIGDIGRVSILKNKASSNQQITGIRFKKRISADYAYYYLVSNRKYFYVDLYKTTLPIVNQKKIISIPIIVPNLEVQQKIVDGLEALEKIRTIDDLCIIDELDWNNEFKTISKYFFEFQFNTEKLSIEHSHQLDLLKKLRQQILQDAVQGKLVLQDPKDESASLLLERIMKEKTHLISVGKLPKEKKVSFVNEVIPFHLPSKWIWCRLSDIAEAIDPNPSHRMPHYVNHGIPFISTENFKSEDMIDFNVGKKVTEETLKEHIKRYEIHDDSFAFSRIGSIGKTIKLPTERNYCLSHALSVINPFSKQVNLQYLRLVLSTDFILKQAKSDVKSISVPDLGMAKIRNFFIPLPPSTEQYRIVHKIGLLIKLCDELEQSIQQNQKYTKDLLQVALKEALEPKPS